MDSSNGVSSCESVPQECSATIRNCFFEENERSYWVSKGGVAKNESSRDRDTTWKKTSEDGDCMGLLGLLEGLCGGTEWEDSGFGGEAKSVSISEHRKTTKPCFKTPSLGFGVATGGETAEDGLRRTDDST
ncbi:unnamed protein product [Ilex paraguariensis]|uniref:Uncharacterized protein n=1 Tax=Ilex paraguariensis TaxID=185542 RepID=A0ABC8SAY1_9AQUA